MMALGFRLSKRNGFVKVRLGPGNIINIRMELGNPQNTPIFVCKIINYAFRINGHGSLDAVYANRWKQKRY